MQDAGKNLIKINVKIQVRILKILNRNIVPILSKGYTRYTSENFTTCLALDSLVLEFYVNNLTKMIQLSTIATSAKRVIIVEKLIERRRLFIVNIDRRQLRVSQHRMQWTNTR